MSIFKISDNIYSVGVIDWNIRNFHGYSTERGTTYNAYLILDKKITLIDTVKSNFADELLQNISSITPLDSIDYIVSNHVEMDHSGSIPQVFRACSNATVVTSASSGVKGLTAHYGDNLKLMPVKTGDELDLGENTLKFVSTPMLHWPDNMVCFIPQKKLLFSNDGFGQHLATSSGLASKENLDIVLYEAKKYYANILMPFGSQTRGALGVVGALNPQMIAPSHGVVWDSYVDKIVKAYEAFSNPQPDNSAVVVYDSMWGSTERMAKAVLDAFTQLNMSVKFFDLKNNTLSAVVTEILNAKYIAVGSPTLNNTFMPTVGAFLTYIKGLAPKNKVGFAFGSYGWSGQSAGEIHSFLQNAGFNLPLEPFKLSYVPKQQELQQLAEAIKTLVNS